LLSRRFPKSNCRQNAPLPTAPERWVGVKNLILSDLKPFERVSSERLMRNQGDVMRRKGLAIGYAVLTLTTSMAATPSANAKGCIKGAIVGGVAGHVAGHHGAIGAAAGCVIGHHEANKRQGENKQ
jgi:hypothetical protein